MLEPYIPAIQLALPFLVCAVFLIFFKPIASRYGMVDRPNARKTHVDHVPIIGGLGIFISFLVYTIISGVFIDFTALMAGCLVLLAIGTIDDVKDLNPKFRLFCQLIAALIMIYGGNIALHDIGDILGSGSIHLSVLSIPFTIFATIGVVNAFNMVDGVDGLAGTLIIMTTAALAYVCYQSGLPKEFQLLSALISAILAFNAFNARFFGRRKAAIFMGDAGSMFLGFLLAWFFIYLSQKPVEALSPVSAGWIFGLPMMDAVCVILRRVFRGESPLTPGRDHLHHQLLERGFSVNQTLLIMAIFHGAMIMIGLVCNSFSFNETTLFWMFISLAIFHLFATPILLTKNMQQHSSLPQNTSRS